MTCRITYALVVLVAGCAHEAVGADAGDSARRELPSDAAGLGDAVGGDDAGSETTSLPICGTTTPTEIDADAPLFLYYGAYGADAASTQTLNLVTSGAEIGGEAVLALNREPRRGCGDPWGDVGDWLARGGKIAHVLGQNRGTDELRELMARPNGVDELIETFHSGFHYVAIDEVAMADAGWADGGELADAFTRLVEELARRGYDRRVILYVNSYNIVTQDRVHDYGQVLRACRDHCRVLASEVYIRTQYVMDAPRYDVCNGNLDCFETALRRFENLAPGVSGRTISILGLSSSNADGLVHYDDPAHPHPLCDGPGDGGALRRQYLAATGGDFGRRSPGIGAYTLARVPHPSFSSPQGACLMTLNGERAWPRAAEETPPAPEPSEPAPSPGIGAHVHAHIACQLFDDGYADATPHVQTFRANADPNAKVCDATGRCRRWFGRCVTSRASDGHQHDVRFVGLAADGTIETGEADAVLPLGSHDVRISGSPDPHVYFRGVVSTAADGHTHTLRCSVWNGTTEIASSDAITRFDTSGTPRLCVPGLGFEGCGVWLRCRAE
jgi:hypothetical protein